MKEEYRQYDFPFAYRKVRKSYRNLYIQDSPYYMKARKSTGDVATVVDTKSSIDLNTIKFQTICPSKIQDSL